MSRIAFVGSIAATLLFAVQIDLAHGAACVTACKDEVAACVSADCQGLTKRPLRQCKRGCKRTLVRDCIADLSVCGATTARPAKPSGGGGGAGGGGGGGYTGGGW